jgi:hypothetical protein
LLSGHGSRGSERLLVVRRHDERRSGAQPASGGFRRHDLPSGAGGEFGRRAGRAGLPPALPSSAGQSHRYSYMAEAAPTEYFIQGITSKGKKFRPSDWSERLAGVMACFGPGARKGPNAYMQYSLYVRPTMIGDLKCVILDSRLRDIEPMAFDFVLNFAKDNDLVVTEACELQLEHVAPHDAKRHVI